MREDLDETLEAEQLAAAAAARRRLNLRDRLLEAEDRQRTAVVWCSDGQAYRGTVAAVGVDHLVLAEEGVERWLALAHIVAVELR